MDREAAFDEAPAHRGCVDEGSGVASGKFVDGAI